MGYMKSYMKSKGEGVGRRLSYFQKKSVADAEYAIKHMGEGSVYCFFLSNNLLAWLIVLVTSGVQVMLLEPFITAAEIELREAVDLVYTWECSRSNSECQDTSNAGPFGWVLFGVLMAIFLSKDVICGLKLIILSGKRRQSHSQRARFFLGGVLLCCINIYTIHASAIYNKATATSDTELIFNSGLILFITEIDEKVFELIDSNNPRWIDNLKEECNQEKDIDYGKEGEEEKEEEEEKVEEEEEQEEEKDEKEDKEERRERRNTRRSRSRRT